MESITATWQSVQSVVTTYLAPTMHRGARIKVSCDAGSKIVPWDYELSPDENYRAAASALIGELGWDNLSWHMGALPRQGTGNACCVFVCTSFSVAL